MNITLTDVDKDNYEDVCDLSVADNQYDYVADNMWSLVEYQFGDLWWISTTKTKVLGAMQCYWPLMKLGEQMDWKRSKFVTTRIIL